MKKIIRVILECFYGLLIFLGCEFFLVVLSFAFGAGSGGKFLENLFVVAILNGCLVAVILFLWGLTKLHNWAFNKPPTK